MKIIDWIYQNREWVFSGIGITVISGVYYIFQRRKRKNRDNSGNIIKQTNKGTNNTQIGIQSNYYSVEERDE